MNLFANMPIGRKLGVGFGILTALLVVQGVVSYRASTELAAKANNIYQEGTLSTDSAGDLRYLSTEMRLQQWKLLELQANERASTFERIDSLKEELKKEQEEYAKGAVSEEDKRNLAKFEENLSKYFAQSDKLENLLKANNEEAATTLMKTSMKTAYDDGLVKVVEEIAEWNVKNAESLVGSAQTSAKQTSNLLITLMVVAIGLSGVIAIAVTKSIVPGVKATVAKLQMLCEWCISDLEKAVVKMSNGDLTERVTPRSTPLDLNQKDEIGVLASTFNETLGKIQSTVTAYNSSMNNLSGLMAQVANRSNDVSRSGRILGEASDETAKSAAEIARNMKEVGQAVSETSKTSDEIAGAAEQLAMSAQNAASAMNVLRSGIDQVSTSSSDQRAAAQRAAEVASQGGVAVEKTIQSMAAIEHQVTKSSLAVKELGEKQAQIQAIVSTIDDIAGQTNLLALNAAIEAARAGEHGRGFAVVADEVRKLAERSSHATKEIASLIETVNQGVEEAIASMDESADEVTKGAAFSSEAQTALTDILSSIERVRVLASENESLVVEMIQNSAKVEESVTSVASIAEETAAGAEEMNAGAEEMTASTQEVSSAVTQQSAKIQEVSELSSELNSLAEELKELVGQFKFDQTSETKPNLKLAA
jgi:methyl-accepting chemotaxis protein